MPFWSGDRLKQELPKIIDPFDPKLIDCAAYTMTVGNEVYITPHAGTFDPQATTKRQLSPKESFTIPAGQFAFLLTEEKLSFPPNILGFISMKATAKFRGLINVSGFHVDPGYDRRLVFSVFNAGPSPVHLQQGDSLFLLWIAELDQKSSEAYTRTPGYGFTEIPTGLINNIPGEIHSLQSLSKQIKDLKAETGRKFHDFDKSLFRHKVYAGIGVTLFILILGWAARGLLPTIDSLLPSTTHKPPVSQSESTTTDLEKNKTGLDETQNNEAKSKSNEDTVKDPSEKNEATPVAPPREKEKQD